jgi:hypothetical protein
MLNEGDELVHVNFMCKALSHGIVPSSWHTMLTESYTHTFVAHLWSRANGQGTHDIKIRVL